MSTGLKPPSLLTIQALLALLDCWVAQGWLRPLDRAFAAFIAELDPAGDTRVPLAAALVSQRLGHGHIALALDAWLAEPDAGLAATEAEAQAALPSRRFQALQLDEWRRCLQHSPLVAGAEDDRREALARPLVLAGDRLYLRRYWRYLRQVETALAARLTLPPDPPPNLAASLAELFPARPDHSECWQRYACALAARGHFSIITGGPGTGKTTTVARLLALLQQTALAAGRPLAIGLAAPTGKAAARLSTAIAQQLQALDLSADLRAQLPTEARTLHRLLGSRPQGGPPRQHRDQPLALDLLVVDEASMIDLELMAYLLEALPLSARLILLGDKDQLASVEAGAVLGDLCRHAEAGYYTPATRDWLAQSGGRPPTAPGLIEGRAGRHALEQQVAVLRHTHRFGEDSGIGRLARSVNAQDSAGALAILQQSRRDLARLGPPLDNAAFRRFIVDGLDADRPAYGAYLRRLHATRPPSDTPPAAADWIRWGRQVLAAFDDFRLLCALRQGAAGVEAHNQQIAQALLAAALIEHTEGWYEGRPVLVTRNDYALGLMNGDIGIALKLPAPEAPFAPLLQVAFPRDDGSLKLVRPGRLHAVETVFAMTVHKAQGSEFNHAALLLPERAAPGLNKELLYTAITRARGAFTLLEAASGVLETAVARRARRENGLDLGRGATA